MSDLRTRLIEAAGQALERGVCDLHEETGNWWGPGQECGRRVGTKAVDAILPVVEAELVELEQIWEDAIGHLKAAHLGEIERLKGGAT